jgi:hypothetical protein
MSRKKPVDIPENEKNVIISIFIRNSLSSVGAAEHLLKCKFSNLSCLSTAAILCHHGIESLFKACVVHAQAKIFFIHDLNTLLQKINFIHLNNGDLKEMEKINDYFFYRYPLDEERFQKMKETLEKIKSETVESITDLPGQLGTEDIEKAICLYLKISNNLPNSLNGIYQNECDTYEKLHLVSLNKKNYL